MKYVIFSDVQGNAKAMKTFRNCMLEFPRDKTICLGDLVYRGKSYDDNRVVNMARKIKSECVLGNHEEDLKGKSDLKISDTNLAYLSNLPRFLKGHNILFYHSSQRAPGQRLRSQENIQKEAHYIQDRHPYYAFACFGHSHRAGVYSYDQEGLISHPLKKEMQLEEGKLHLINPGGLGLYHDLPQTFMILDTGKRDLNYYTLDELQDISARRSLIMSFEESWMPHLRGNSSSWYSLKKEARTVQKHLNTDGKFDGLIEIMKSLNPPVNFSKKKKREYFEKYSLKLAHAIDILVDPHVMKHYDLKEPLHAREHYLSR